MCGFVQENYLPKRQCSFKPIIASLCPSHRYESILMFRHPLEKDNGNYTISVVCGSHRIQFSFSIKVRGEIRRQIDPDQWQIDMSEGSQCGFFFSFCWNDDPTFLPPCVAARSGWDGGSSSHVFQLDVSRSGPAGMGYAIWYAWANSRGWQKFVCHHHHRRQCNSNAHWLLYVLLQHKQHRQHRGKQHLHLCTWYGVNRILSSFDILLSWLTSFIPTQIPVLLLCHHWGLMWTMSWLTMRRWRFHVGCQTPELTWRLWMLTPSSLCLVFMTVKEVLWGFLQQEHMFVRLS